MDRSIVLKSLMILFSAFSVVICLISFMLDDSLITALDGTFPQLTVITISHQVGLLF